MKNIESQPPQDLQVVVLHNDYGNNEEHYGFGVFVDKVLWVYDWNLGDYPERPTFYKYSDNYFYIASSDWESLQECSYVGDDSEIDLDEACKCFEDKLDLALPLIAGLTKDPDGKFVIKKRQYPNRAKVKHKRAKPTLILYNQKCRS